MVALNRYKLIKSIKSVTYISFARASVKQKTDARRGASIKKVFSGIKLSGLRLKLAMLE